MNYKLAVIGVGNMAKAIISGIQKADVAVSEIRLYDKNSAQYSELAVGACPYVFCEDVEEAVNGADCVLLAVKPQNFPELLAELATCASYSSRLYITIAAGITVKTVSDALGNAPTVRVLPNIPMVIGNGVSAICRNSQISSEQFSFVCSLLEASGSTVLIDEAEMNRIIGVTSSSPAYVFKFIDSIYKGALVQGLDTCGLLDAICDVFIGSALLLKDSQDTPEQLISRVASKGGTTEKALEQLENAKIDEIIASAMVACTNRAEELGNSK
jgi:pyrroline-5-carboxylate reductase